MEKPSQEALDHAAELYDLLQERGFDLEQLREREVGKVALWQMGMKNAEHEFESHDLYGIELRSEYDEDKEPFSPATPAKITPTSRRGVKRDHKVYLAFGDEQIDYRRIEDDVLDPLHDEAALNVLTQINRDLMPEELVGLGDGNDFANLSKFASDSDHFHRTMGPAFQRKHDLWAQLKADNPNSKRKEMDSNHVKRLGQWVLQNMPQMYNMRRPGQDSEYPIMSYPYLANFDHLGVEWVSGYGAAEYIINEELGPQALSFRHGTEHSSASTTAAAKALKNRPDINTIQGHDHRESRAFRTDRFGRYIGALVVGALARTTGEVPGYHSAVDDNGNVVHSQQNWQQGLLVIRDYGGGNYEFQNVPIKDGLAYYNGKEYNGNERTIRNF